MQDNAHLHKNPYPGNGPHTRDFVNKDAQNLHDRQHEWSPGWEHKAWVLWRYEHWVLHLQDLSALLARDEVAARGDTDYG